MNHHFIYAKTGKADDSVAIHPHRLAARYRRFLALLDGKRSVAELATVSRPEEIQETIDYLVENGFIEKVGEQTNHDVLGSSDDPFLSASLTPDMFEEFKRRAVSQLEKSFGAVANTAAQRIAAAQTPAALRAALRDAEDMVASPQNSVSPDEVRALFKRIGANFI